MIYLNNAATSFPKPDIIPTTAYKSAMSPPTGENRGGTDDGNMFSLLRKALAGKIGVNTPERIVLFPNSTYALNCAIFGMNLKKGDTIVTTMAEHNAVLRPCHELTRNGINVIFVPTDDCGYVNPYEWEKAVRRYRPLLSIMTHASNVTGAVNNISELIRISHRYNSITLVDASQSLGIIPYDNKIINADMIAFTSHKYLLSTPGCGGLYVSENVNLNPHILGGTGVDSDNENMPEYYPDHLQPGTSDYVSASCLYRALLWAEKNPVNLRQIISLTEYLSEKLLSLGCQVIVPEGEKTPVISFATDKLPVGEIGYLLNNAYDISIRTGLHCSPLIHKCIGTFPEGTVRVSLGRFNNKNDCDMLIHAMKEITKERN